MFSTPDYDLYNFTEPWDSPRNRKILNRRLSYAFQCPTDPAAHAAGSTVTSYVAIVGKSAKWRHGKAESPNHESADQNLANQTAKATEDISAQIAAIQSASSGAVTAIQEVNRTIGRMAGMAADVESSVTQQSTAVSTIATEMQRAASDAELSRDRIVQVKQTATGAGSIADDVGHLAEDLGAQAATLLAEVGQFLTHVRAA
jgi:hypothetical protein